MSVLFGPILAQIVTLGVADRTEARYIATKDSYAEAVTAPRAAIGLDWKHSKLSNTLLNVGYGPTFLYTPLLDEQKPEMLVFHTASAGLTHIERRQRTTVTFSEQFAYTLSKLQIIARGGGLVRPPGGQFGVPIAPVAPTAPGTPTAPAGTPDTGTTGTGTPPASPTTGVPTQNGDPTVELFTESTSIGVLQLISPVLNVGGEVAYIMAGALHEDQRNLYPLVRGPRASIFAANRLSHTDTLTTTFTSQYATTSTSGNTVWINVASEQWAHKFDSQTSSVLAGGLSASRNSQPDGTVFWQVFPVFNASITSMSRLGRGILAVGLNAYVAPILDPVRISVDPRLSLGAFIGWNRDRFTTSLNVNSALALGQQENQAAGFNYVTGQWINSYLAGKNLSLDAGLRGVYQSFGGQTTIPASLVAFVGVTIGAYVPLNH